MGVGKTSTAGELSNPSDLVEYLGRCSNGGRKRSTDGMGSFFLGAVSKIGLVGSKKGTRE